MRRTRWALFTRMNQVAHSEPNLDQLAGPTREWSMRVDLAARSSFLDGAPAGHDPLAGRRVVPGAREPARERGADPA